MLTKLKKIDFQKNFKITQKIFKFNSIFSINIKEHAVSRFVQNSHTYDPFSTDSIVKSDKNGEFRLKMSDWLFKNVPFDLKMVFFHSKMAIFKRIFFRFEFFKRGIFLPKLVGQ